ncbi:MAG: hypothetical protein KAW12_30370 [Candidatus Aminicenantes bacterium]|nr:hypothetical protein [Candidatus Aminicenantes bacterium]
MEVIQKERLLGEIKPHLKNMVTDIMVESFKRGEMKEIFEDLLLAKAMEETENEENLSYEEALKQIEW